MCNVVGYEGSCPQPGLQNHRTAFMFVSDVIDLDEGEAKETVVAVTTPPVSVVILLCWNSVFG